MESKRVHIIGAGPAGASLAFMLKGTTHEVFVYEASPALGSKACGWAVPAIVERVTFIPKEAILTEIRRVRVFLNGRELTEIETKSKWGYVLNKPLWLKILLEASRVELSRRITEEQIGYLTTNSDVDIVVIATGFYWSRSPRERINAVQYVIGNLKLSDVESVEFWFEQDNIGYYWVFPQGDTSLRIGVGGFKSYRELWSMLDSFVKKRLGACTGRKLGAGGAPIIVSGIQESLLEVSNRVYATGEAVGAVFPLTGEGIRPSIITSSALAKHIIGGRAYVEELRKSGLLNAMKAHKRVLEYLRKATPKERGEVLASLPSDFLVDFAVGDVNGRKAFMKLASTIRKPGVLARLARLLLAE
uniref:NAD(P)/FAD-dependent oxidoreductase n=1 Tax=Fervidicoccus fontis TaxID=683846 RepID=A0A7J3ZJA9_9CREN